MVQTLSDEALMVGIPLVPLDAKPGVATKGVCQVLYPGQWVSIRNSLFIQEAKVDAQAQATIFLT